MVGNGLLPFLQYTECLGGESSRARGKAARSPWMQAAVSAASFSRGSEKGGGPRPGLARGGSRARALEV